jgi:hypothetical protein
MIDSASSLTGSITDTITDNTEVESDSPTASTFSSSSSHGSDQASPRAQREARAAVLASLESAGSAHAEEVQERATGIHLQSKTIQNQERDLTKNTKALAKQNKLLQREADRGLKAIKELGDAENWADVLERDFLVLEETMRLVDEERTRRGESIIDVEQPASDAKKGRSWLW